MGKGGSSKPSTQYVKTETSSLPEYAKPYYEQMMQSAQGLTLGSTYQPYGQDRIADFTPAQQWAMNNQMQAKAPGQYQTGTGLATAAGLGSLQAGQYNPQQFAAQQVGLPNLQNYQMSAPQQVNVSGQQNTAPQMQAAQTSYGSKPLEQYQMKSPGSFGVEQAQQYMSPYQQEVVDIQKREATRDAKKDQLVADLGAARQGTYGGSRQLLAGLERERNLGQQLSDIQQKGSQAAYENAQQQYERDRTAGMTADQANLQAKLQTQQLGTQTGLQAALANLDADSQSRVQNLAAQLQTQGLNADQALQAALANQQAGLTTGKANLDALLQTQQLGTQSGLQALLANQQTGLEAQRLGEQSRQFGASNALAGYGQAGQMAQTLANLGQGQFQTEQQLRDKQLTTATMDQALQQQHMDQQYQDFLRQQGYPLEMLQQYSSLLRGVPVTPSTQTTTSTPTPSLASQILGTGLGAAGAYKALTG